MTNRELLGELLEIVRIDAYESGYALGCGHEPEEVEEYTKREHELYDAIIAELDAMQQLIERMKCCMNCRCSYKSCEGIICGAGMIPDKGPVEVCKLWEVYDVTQTD